jgi:hypothetical protein
MNEEEVLPANGPESVEIEVVEVGPNEYDQPRQKSPELTPTPKQLAVFFSHAKESFFVGGVGMGKTFTLALVILKHSKLHPGTVGLLASPKYDTLRNATLPQVVDAFERLGCVADEHYVVNQLPPKEWGIQPYNKISQKDVLTFKNGSYLLLGGMTNFNKYRGTAFDYICLDEFRDMNTEARNVLLGRLRGKKYKELRLKHQIYYATTPPHNPSYLQAIQAANLPEVLFITGTTYDNIANLPDGYVESLEQSYDNQTLRREVYGELIFQQQNPFAYAFSHIKHVKPCPFDPQQLVYISFDFNINPICAVVLQLTHQRMAFIHEFAVPNADIQQLCQMIAARFPPQRIAAITGDASGMNRSSLSLVLGNHYEIIRIALQLKAQQIVVPKFNPAHLASFRLVNQVLEMHPQLVIDPSCKGLIQDLTQIQLTSTMHIDKSNPQMGHLLDAFRYALHAWGNCGGR